MTYDIKKYTHNELVDSVNYVEYLKQQGELKNIQLNDDHLKVIQYLENNLETQKSAATLLRELGIDFKSQGGKKYLYKLFPQGPINQASEIAQLPLPQGCREYAWGTVF